MCDNDDSNHAVLQNRQPQLNNETDTPVNISFLSAGSTAAVSNKDRNHGHTEW